MNIMNLIDGLDGLATGVSIIILGSFYFIFMGVDKEAAVFIIFLVAILLAFLYFNFNPASIFLGDSGSMLLGFIIAALSLSSMKTAAFTTMIPLLIIMSVPILDTGMAIVRRVIMEEHIFKPDGKHVHHMLLQKGYSQKQVCILIYGITLSYAIFGILLSADINTMTRFGVIAILIIETLIIIERIYITNPNYKIFSKLFA
jgi:UDP-GlcNAc:undecaprenyl-phosphate/decaprenyl-phosphate GlcNAc-1-phosphate transferase